MRPALQEVKEEALINPEVAQEYERLSTVYELRKNLIRIRMAAGLTQEELAVMLNTKKSNISRLENVHSKISPNLATIEKYAKAAGYTVEVRFMRDI